MVADSRVVTSAFALPGGLRNNNGDFNNMTNNGYWWSSSVFSGSNAWNRNLNNNNSNINRNNNNRTNGFSGRCCRDLPQSTPGISGGFCFIILGFEVQC